MSRGLACEVCGGPMEARRSTRRYCSVRCRVKAARTLLSVTSDTPDAQAATRGVSAPPASPVPRPSPIAEALPRRIEVRVAPGERLASGGPAGKGGSTAFVVGGRSFDTPREAIDCASR